MHKHLATRFSLLLLTFCLVPAFALAQAPTYLTQWGSTGSATGQFSSPLGVAATSDGSQVYVADAGNARIQIFSGTGVFFGTFGTVGTAAGEFGPGALSSLALDAFNNVYAGDQVDGAPTSGRIEKFNSTGTFTLQWASPLPTSVATDASGNVYVLSQYWSSLTKYSPTGAFLNRWGSHGSGNFQFNNPTAVATDASNYVYVADGNNRVVKYTSGGGYVTKWSTGVTPNGIACDAAGHVYVSLSNDTMAMYSNTGALLATWGTTGTGAGEFTGATGLGTDGIGDVFVADTGNDRVERFGPAATPTKTSSWGQLKKLYR